MSAEPAFHGFIENTFDALLLFEACRRGDIPKITRRLQEFEKKAMVMSGAIFVFDEEETGIKRWTDGLSWSPSRTLGNFLVYRELDKKSSSKGSVDYNQGSIMDGNTAAYREEEDHLHSPGAQMILPKKRSLSDASGTVNKSRERALVGSLTSTFRFRPDGLVKKTISLAGLHMIGYYRIEDVTAGHLRSPSSHVELASLQIASCFLSPTLFRVPPLVDLGSDGQLRYKGEMDPSVSPVLHSRSGSSQGFGTPIIPSMHTRTRSNSPNTPVVLPRDNENSSPNRRSAHRNSNRYEPYNAGRVHSPPPVAGFTAYPFPPNGQSYSPHQTYPAVLPREDYYPPSRELGSNSGLSPAMAGLGTMNPNWGSGPQSTSLSRSATNDQVYHPRQAAPFIPNEASQQQQSNLSSENYGFRPPSRPSPLMSNSPTPSYESYSAPSMQTQYSSSSNSSRYGVPPPSYTQHGRPYGHQSQHSGSSTYSIGSYRDYNHLPAASPRHSPQEYSILSQPSYPTNSNRSSLTKPPGYPSPPEHHQQLQSQPLQHQVQPIQLHLQPSPTGLVMGASEGPEQRLGLGLQGIRGKIPSLDSTGRQRASGTRQRSGDLGFDGYEGGEEDERREDKLINGSGVRSLLVDGKEQPYWDSSVVGWQSVKDGYSEKRRSR